VCQIFNIDKLLACFSGRPPLLSRRYVLTSLPSDISDEVLFAGKPAIEQAVKSLDSQGWNMDGKLHSTTLPRARYMLSCIRDHIMEIALGHEETPISTLL
jgi:hypothetical protein